MRSWFYLHTERSCSREGCGRPTYLGGICALHLAGATAVERATALWFHDIERAACAEPADLQR